MSQEMDLDQLFHARVRSVDAVIAAGMAIERLALGHGLSPLESIRFRFAVEEFCSERLSHAFGPHEQPEAQIALELRPGEFVVVIEDAGSPIEATDAAAGTQGWMAQ